MRVYVGVTGWYRFLQMRRATEVNFWQPSGGRRFRRISEGEPFFFKTHYSHGNRIVGGGFLSRWASLSMTRTWECFGEYNDCATIEEIRLRIFEYRRKQLHDEGIDPEIGCIMLRDVQFFESDEAMDPPPQWPSNIVQGRSYHLEGSYLEQVLRALLTRNLSLIANYRRYHLMERRMTATCPRIRQCRALWIVAQPPTRRMLLRCEKESIRQLTSGPVTADGLRAMVLM